MYLQKHTVQSILRATYLLLSPFHSCSFLPHQHKTVPTHNRNETVQVGKQNKQEIFINWRQGNAWLPLSNSSLSQGLPVSTMMFCGPFSSVTEPPAFISPETIATIISKMWNPPETEWLGTSELFLLYLSLVTWKERKQQGNSYTLRIF